MNKSGLSERATPSRSPSWLNGWWVVLDATLGGVRLPLETLPHLTLYIRDGCFELGCESGTIDVNEALLPATLRWNVTRGPNRGRVLQAIYQYRGNTLRICYGLSDGERPLEFAAPPASRRCLVAYQRVVPLQD